jgi:hypothetical protein
MSQICNALFASSSALPWEKKQREQELEITYVRKSLMSKETKVTAEEEANLGHESPSHWNPGVHQSLSLITEEYFQGSREGKHWESWAES